MDLIYNYLTVLSIFFVVRCSLIICYRFLKARIKKMNKVSDVKSNACMDKKDNNSMYYIFWLSVLWVLVRYSDFICCFISEIL